MCVPELEGAAAVPEERGRAAKRSPSVLGPRWPATPQNAVLDLQRSAGNRAVGRVLRSRKLARYEAGEHALLGGPGKTLKVGDVEVTEAELSAMGDFYVDPAKMSADAAAHKAQFEKLLADIRDDRERRAAGKAGVEEKVWIVDTAHRPKAETYTQLAAANFAHFAPGKAGGPDHKQVWEDLHRRALDIAHAAASTDKRVPDEARVINAFAAHFLTDAFSAGHLANKRDVMNLAQPRFDLLPTTGTFAKENWFSKAVAKGMHADPKITAELAKWELRIAGWGEFTEARTSELIYGMRGQKPEMFFGLFARTVHDELDYAIRGGADKGLEVTNDNGDVWTLAGDETLRLSPTTQRIAGKAVQIARDNLATAASTPGPLDYGALFRNVWRFTPRPTTADQHAKAVAAKKLRAEAKPPDPPLLKSPRWGTPPNSKLAQCFQDQARLGPHDPDKDAVTKVQQALVDVEAITHQHYDLGPTGVDGKYGSHTALAVRKFKKDRGLGFDQFPDVGPGTMAELDRLFTGAAPKPPEPVLEPGGRPGWEQLPEAVAAYTDPGSRTTVDAIVKVAGEKLDVLLDTLQEKDIDRARRKTK
jgi:peptidoglycan hydrolase-like protein with peptidoglycan-binding domain